jgi:hypothetical protein
LDESLVPDIVQLKYALETALKLSSLKKDPHSRLLDFYVLNQQERTPAESEQIL